MSDDEILFDDIYELHEVIGEEITRLLWRFKKCPVTVCIRG